MLSINRPYQPHQPPRTGIGRASLALLLGMAFASMALAAGSGDHTHPPKSTPHGSMMSGGAHAHDQWIDPPADYAGMRNPDWEDRDALVRGHEIYEQSCVVCHGLDGEGTGPIADNLGHHPADLTTHFHRGPGLGDGYLFWRVSEGGAVEPFKSQGSAMPAFKSTLDDRQRWDVLTFVHHLFHRTAFDQHDEEDEHGSMNKH